MFKITWPGLKAWSNKNVLGQFLSHNQCLLGKISVKIFLAQQTKEQNRCHDWLFYETKVNYYCVLREAH